MKKLSACAAPLAILALTGCAPRGETPPALSPTVPPMASDPVVSPTPVELAAEPYALSLDGTDYAVHGPFLPSGLFAAAQVTEYPEEFPFPSSRRYEGDEFTANTFLDEEGERFISLTTWGPGVTPEGIGVGSTLAELKAAYPDSLIYVDGACGNGTEPAAYTRRYDAYRNGDGTNCAYSFYLKEKLVVTVAVYDGLDAPRDWFQPETVLGDPRIRIEVVSDKPANPSVRYFIELDDGAEETVLEIRGGAEEHDLDGDGVVEIVAYLSENNKKALGIYDKVNGEIVYLDVNKTLGADWSDYMGLVGNLGNEEYQNAINAGFRPAGQPQREEVYFYKDGALTYACTFAEAMGW